MVKKDKQMSIPFLLFTFLYAVTFYVFLIGFYYWHWHTGDESGEE